MIFRYIRPSGILSRFIRHYWVLEADASEGSVGERVIPTGNIELMFHYKNTFLCKNAAFDLPQPRSFISGITNKYADVFTQGDSGVIAVTFYPFGACNFFRFPLADIENTTVNLHDIYSNTIKEVEERIQECTSLQQRIRIIESYLLKCLVPRSGDDLMLVDQCVSMVNSCSALITSSALSSKLFMSSKTLERKFTSLIGKSPKQFIRIVRFQHIIKELSVPGNKNLSQVAVDNGYFDQAHFIKDFKTLSGYTPSEFLNLGPCHADYFDQNP
jgi:AraC-like DNA-binding protein